MAYRKGNDSYVPAAALGVQQGSSSPRSHISHAPARAQGSKMGARADAFQWRRI
jgi:hypothetical protein